MSSVSSCEYGDFCEKNIKGRSAKWAKINELIAELAEAAKNGLNQEISAASAVIQNLIF